MLLYHTVHSPQRSTFRHAVGTPTVLRAESVRISSSKSISYYYSIFQSVSSFILNPLTSKPSIIQIQINKLTHPFTMSTATVTALDNKPSLKTAQLNAIHRMLSLNNDTHGISSSGTTSSAAGAGAGISPSIMYNDTPAGTSYNQWKILIYDVPCRSIISPLLSVSQLRARGVTLHLLIGTEREAIPDVPAVYFVKPTRENLKMIAQDCAKRLYSKVHINFATKLDRSLMEEFGKLVVQNGCLDMIASLHDQYLDFVCLERNLFSLCNQKDSYALMNQSGVTDVDMDKYLSDVAYGLLSVVGTSGSVPVIRCAKVRMFCCYGYCCFLFLVLKWMYSIIVNLCDHVMYNRVEHRKWWHENSTNSSQNIPLLLLPATKCNTIVPYLSFWTVTWTSLLPSSIPPPTKHLLMICYFTEPIE
jgi:Proteins involved in synaptic transmission and general secretion, Sec1 family